MLIITNSSRGTFRRFTIFAKDAKIAPLLKAPDEGVRFIQGNSEMRIIFSILLVFLVGCVSELKTNLSNEHIGGCDELFSGTWSLESKGSDELYLKANITKDCKIVDVYMNEAMDDSKDRIKYRAIFTKINGLRFLNLNPIDDNGKISKINYLVRYTWDSPDNISFYLLDNEEFRKSIRDGHIAGKIKSDDKDPIYTLEINDELYVYIEDNVNKLFSKRLPLVRVKNKSNKLIQRDF